MTDPTTSPSTRRAFLARLGRTTLVIGATGWWGGGCVTGDAASDGAGSGASDGGATLAACPTPSDVEGPFYTADAPVRSALAEAGEPGARIVVTGQILDASDCETPLPGYVLDLWHADDSGRYDNAGFKLRGRFVADDAGRFSIETVLPGRYPDRPVRHIHVKVRAPGGEERLTTQIYFEEGLSDAFPGPRASLSGGVAEVIFVVTA